MMLTTAKEYISKQIGIYEVIKGSFPELSMNDYSITTSVYDLYRTVRDTLQILRELLGEAKDANTYEDFKTVMSEMEADYRAELGNAKQNADHLEKIRDMGYIRAKQEVKECQLFVDVMSSVRVGLENAEQYNEG